jgi:hypothetical protein
MAFPTSLDEMRQQGYKFEGDGECKGCGDPIEWWTTPRGKKMPCNHGTATPHWTTCTEADSFRGDKQPSNSKITALTLNMDWLKQQAANCHCVVCKKLTGRV